MSRRIEDKVALITGAGKGIGRAIALTMAREGAHIAVNDIDMESAREVADLVRSSGRKATAIEADVSVRDRVENMVAETLREFGRIDILVNNAGGGKVMPFLDITEAQWDGLTNLNLKSVFLCSQAVGRHMVSKKSGKMVNIASIAGHEALPGTAGYSPSKAGVLQLTRLLAVEWAAYNINVNAVSPGFTVTPHTQNTMKEHPDLLRGYVSRIPSRRPATVEDVANAVLFLASSEADDIFGQEIVVDGGTSILHSGYLPKE
ncbi:MAG: glucose 1-dehydrogenase [Dehalococcoidia bacterium]|nr:glucose 1-dehydrogenase [Dehalococcoidia bacterium]